MARHVIAPVDELPPGTRKFLTIDERPIAVFNIKGEFFGLLNRCPHQGAALCEGPLIGLAQSSDPGTYDDDRARRHRPSGGPVCQHAFGRPGLAGLQVGRIPI